MTIIHLCHCRGHTYAACILNLPVRSLFGEVKRLLDLLMVVPVSSATAERYFALHSLKTYLRDCVSRDSIT